MESFFELLRPLYLKYGCTYVFFTEDDDGATNRIHWDLPIEREGFPEFDTSLLTAFEKIFAEQGGGQCMLLYFEAQASAFVFYRYHFFAIDFHGTDEMWSEVVVALYGSEEDYEKEARKYRQPVQGYLD